MPLTTHDGQAAITIAFAYIEPLTVDIIQLMHLFEVNIRISLR